MTLNELTTSFVHFHNGSGTTRNSMLRDLPGRLTSSDDVYDAELFVNPTVSVSDDHHQNDLNDDIFGSAPTSPTLVAQQDAGEHQARNHGRDHPSDVARLRSLHVTSGYREGIAISKEQYIQAGFDEGYSLGGEIGLRAGWCLGALEGIRRALKSAAAAGPDEAHSAVKQEVLALCEQAGVELQTASLFSSEHFDAEGISLFGVTLREGQAEGDVTVSDVAAAHPVIARWDRIVHDLAHKLSINLQGIGQC